MGWRQDSRIPLTIVQEEAALGPVLAAGPPAAVLRAGPGGAVAGALVLESYLPVMPHQAGCACCAGRLPAAVALDRLFQARLRDRCPWFERVVALAPEGPARSMLEQALAADPLTMARFRRA